MPILEPDQRTSFDLSWRMFGIPVRVHPLFWLIACLIGAPWLDEGATYLALWVACMFVSILVHELGHVLTGRAFGANGHILLYSFGGLAIGSCEQRKRWQRIAVLFAGPLAGLLLFGVVYLVRVLAFPANVAQLPWTPPRGMMDPERYLLDNLPTARRVFLLGSSMLLWMNLAWSLLNLLPIYPLDGGQITSELCAAVSPRNGLRVALGTSFLLSALLAVHGLMRANGRVLLPFLPFGDTFTAIFFGLLAMENFMMLQALRAPPPPWDDEDSRWQR